MRTGCRVQPESARELRHRAASPVRPRRLAHSHIRSRAAGIATGRPVLNPDQTPTADGRTVCPAVEGATNWFSTAFSPATGLYYVQALEKCTVYARAPEAWRAGESFYGGSTRSTNFSTVNSISSRNSS